MSRRFQQIARFVVQNPNDVALDSVKAISATAGVQPSTLVRFAQSFGYGGFSDMQRVFQSRLLTAAPSLNDRLSALRRELGGRAGGTNLKALSELVIGDIAALQHLMESITEESLADAARLLAKARTIHIIGQLRAYPVANYLRYVLTHLRRDVRLLDGAGGLAAEQAQLMDEGCVLLAVSFRFYAREVIDIVEAAAKRGIPIVALTDSQLSPLAKHATVTLEVPEGEFNFTHSLAAPMCLAQAIVICMTNLLPEGSAAGSVAPGRGPLKPR
ncbi:MAG: MurR/RpiR family transcriptional regulator [Inquilinus sp.]|nr:MurR/RpiR family transcriptional regulator [Inquilinus sp.]